MAPKVTVLRVCITCDKCKAKLLKTVAKLEGVNKLETDDEKSTLTVAGPVDPHEVVACARKVCAAEILSIGDPKKPEDKKKEEEEKKKKAEEEKKKKAEEERKKEAAKRQCCPNPCYCRMCGPNYMVHPVDMPGPYGHYQEPAPCTIM